MGNELSNDIKDIAATLEAEDMECTPTSSSTSRYRDLDPRSPTEGIDRTPIMARQLCQRQGVYSWGALRRRWKSDQELTSNHSSPNDIGCYRVIEDDPRSPTVGIIRTPIQVLSKYNVGDTKNISEDGSLDSVNMECDAIISVPNCRSPSSEICRTPIQVAVGDDIASCKDDPHQYVPVEACSQEKNHTREVPTWYTPVSKTSSKSPYVYTDDTSITVQGIKDKKIYDENSIHEKENGTPLRRNTTFTPESSKTGVKIRTPLSSRGNFQDSPSQFLKIMQVQRVGQELGNMSENSLETISKTFKKVEPVVEWDNKDSTLIM